LSAKAAARTRPVTDAQGKRYASAAPTIGPAPHTMADYAGGEGADSEFLVEDVETIVKNVRG
jgi:hypothetical protein